MLNHVESTHFIPLSGLMAPQYPLKQSKSSLLILFTHSLLENSPRSAEPSRAKQSQGSNYLRHSFTGSQERFLIDSAVGSLNCRGSSDANVHGRRVLGIFPAKNRWGGVVQEPPWHDFGRGTFGWALLGTTQYPPKEIQSKKGMVFRANNMISRHGML